MNEPTDYEQAVGPYHYELDRSQDAVQLADIREWPAIIEDFKRDFHARPVVVTPLTDCEVLTLMLLANWLERTYQPPTKIEENA